MASTDSESRADTALIGFYGFKGGTGRTLAAVHMAYHYARIGKRVLLVDADLGAPGLSLWEEQRPQRDDGLIQLLKWLDNAPRAVPTAALLEEHVRHSPADFFAAERDRDENGILDGLRGEVHLMPAGLGSSPDDHDRYIDLLPGSPTAVVTNVERLRELFLVSPYDVVLFDSTAGLHAVGAAMFDGLVDQNVVLFGPSQQAQRGLTTALEMLTQEQVRRSIFAMSPLAWEAGARREAAEAAVRRAGGLADDVRRRVFTISWHPVLARDERLINVADPLSATARDYQRLFLEIEEARGYGIARHTESVDALLDMLKRALTAGEKSLEMLITLFDREVDRAFDNPPHEQREVLAQHLRRRLEKHAWRGDWLGRSGFVRLVVWEIVRRLEALAELDEQAAQSLWAMIVRRNHPARADSARRITNETPPNVERYDGLVKECGEAAREGLRQSVGIFYEEYRRRFGRGLRGIPPVTVSGPGSPNSPVTLEMFVTMAGVI